MHFFRQHISWFKTITLVLVLHLFNYSVNLDDSLLTAAGFDHNQNEIESIVELVLTQLYQEAGALPDEADDTDESKSVTGFVGIVPLVLNYQSILLPASLQKYYNYLSARYLKPVFEICPPPPKIQV